MTYKWPICRFPKLVKLQGLTAHVAATAEKFNFITGQVWTTIFRSYSRPVLQQNHATWTTSWDMNFVKWQIISQSESEFRWWQKNSSLNFDEVTGALTESDAYEPTLHMVLYSALSDQGWLDFASILTLGVLGINHLYL